MSQIALWNLALSRLGDTANVASPDERSRQAELCRMFYDSARRSVLQMRNWSFATKTRALPLVLADDAADRRWAFTYDYPEDALHLFHLFPAGAPQSVPHTDSARATEPDFYPPAQIGDFEVGINYLNQKVVYTNMDQAVARFVVDIVDTGRWSPLFNEALSWFLASQIAGPLIQGESGRNESRKMLEEFNLYMNGAATSDANQRRDRTMASYIPSGIKARS